MNTTEMICTAIQSHGLKFKLWDTGELVLRGNPAEVTQAMRDAIVAFKPDIIAHMKLIPEPKTTFSSCRRCPGTCPKNESCAGGPDSDWWMMPDGIIVNRHCLIGLDIVNAVKHRPNGYKGRWQEPPWKLG